MPKYYRLFLGKANMYAEPCFDGNFVGVDFGIKQNLAHSLLKEQQDFNADFVSAYHAVNPEKSKIAARSACGMVWRVCKEIKTGDLFLCHDGNKRYRIAEVTGDYTYAPGEILPHRRTVCWLPHNIKYSDMSDALRRTLSNICTLCDISAHQKEIELLLTSPDNPGSDTDKIIFSKETYLEEFLVSNWGQTELGQNYDIYEDGESSGQQYSTDAGIIDILAISKDKRELLVVELKKGKPTDVVVGQVLRYMGFVDEELAEDGQTVKGAIIAQEKDEKIKWALSTVKYHVNFYCYQVSFKLLLS